MRPLFVDFYLPPVMAGGPGGSNRYARSNWSTNELKGYKLAADDVFSHPHDDVLRWMERRGDTHWSCFVRKRVLICAIQPSRSALNARCPTLRKGSDLVQRRHCRVAGKTRNKRTMCPSEFHRLLR